MVEDLLALARLDDGRGALPAAVVDLGELARRVVERQAEHRKDLRLEVTGQAWVHGDAPALERVVQNLLDNALRHADRRVGVFVGAEGDQSVLVVADDGPGIPAAERERVFERYARLDDARSRDAGGAGLGLAIVREIVRAHQGEVAVEETSGGDGDAPPWPGARFAVRLPAVSPDAIDPRASRRFGMV
jgi:signal transduction histidine kinase